MKLSMTNHKIFLKGGGFVETRLLRQAIRVFIACSRDPAERKKWQDILEEIEILEMMSTLFI